MEVDGTHLLRFSAVGFRFLFLAILVTVVAALLVALLLVVFDCRKDETEDLRVGEFQPADGLRYALAAGYILALHEYDPICET